MCNKYSPVNDPIHMPPNHPAYVRTDYIVNSDMTIPLTLGAGFMFRAASELDRRTGFPINDRSPHNSPLVLARSPLMPKPQSHG